jgi:replicative DNA helicase
MSAVPDPRPNLRTVEEPRARPYPASVEYERALLGGLMLNEARLDEVRAEVVPDDFTRPEHAALFALLLEMRAGGHPIDLVTVPERAARIRADRFGGIGYVCELSDHVPSTANLAYYARVVARKAVARRAIAEADALREALFDQPDDPGAVIQAHVAALARLVVRDLDGLRALFRGVAAALGWGK